MLPATSKFIQCDGCDVWRWLPPGHVYSDKDRWLCHMHPAEGQVCVAPGVPQPLEAVGGAAAATVTAAAAADSGPSASVAATTPVAAATGSPAAAGGSKRRAGVSSGAQAKKPKAPRKPYPYRAALSVCRCGGVLLGGGADCFASSLAAPAA